MHRNFLAIELELAWRDVRWDFRMTLVPRNDRIWADDMSRINDLFNYGVNDATIAWDPRELRNIQRQLRSGRHYQAPVPLRLPVVPPGNTAVDAISVSCS